jgi:hypothetical protein
MRSASAKVAGAETETLTLTESALDE